MLFVSLQYFANITNKDETLDIVISKDLIKWI